MKRLLPFPLLWVSLVAMWLVLNESIEPGQVLLGALIAYGATQGLRALQEPRAGSRRLAAAAALVATVAFDVTMSNIAVARLVLHRGARGSASGFVCIPLNMHNPAGLAALACIITATPGTAWAGYDSANGMLTMHVLDLVDEEAWIRTIKDRYERRLMEIFG